MVEYFSIMFQIWERKNVIVSREISRLQLESQSIPDSGIYNHGRIFFYNVPADMGA